MTMQQDQQLYSWAQVSYALSHATDAGRQELVKATGLRRTGHWVTVAVTALPPGWRNAYRHDDGTMTEVLCPAILLEEERGEYRHWIVPGEGDPLLRVRSDYEPASPPYGTRAVFADWDGGHLEPASDTDNYAGTLAPGQELPDQETP